MRRGEGLQKCTSRSAFRLGKAIRSSKGSSIPCLPIINDALCPSFFFQHFLPNVTLCQATWGEGDRPGNGQDAVFECPVLVSREVFVTSANRWHGYSTFEVFVCRGIIKGLYMPC